MRVALKIAYDGRVFFGHQRQPDARTVEGECLRALKAARILRDPQEAFFRSASRTDRGVSAVGNVIAFRSPLRGAAALGAFNSRARDVWAWAYAEVPDAFHPRHAEERWYRYHLFEVLPLFRLRAAGALFEGEHDFRWFTSDPPAGPFAIKRIEVTEDGLARIVDVRARSFRRGMVRRIVAAMVAVARGEATESDIRNALSGQRHDFGAAPPEPLFLMDVAYAFGFVPAIRNKVSDEMHASLRETALRERWLRAIEAAARSGPADATTTSSSG